MAIFVNSDSVFWPFCNGGAQSFKLRRITCENEGIQRTHLSRENVGHVELLLPLLVVLDLQQGDEGCQPREDQTAHVTEVRHPQRGSGPPCDLRFSIHNEQRSHQSRIRAQILLFRPLISRSQPNQQIFDHSPDILLICGFDAVLSNAMDGESALLRATPRNRLKLVLNEPSLRQVIPPLGEVRGVAFRAVHQEADHHLRNGHIVKCRHSKEDGFRLRWQVIHSQGDGNGHLLRVLLSEGAGAVVLSMQDASEFLLHVLPHARFGATAVTPSPNCQR